MMYEQSMVGKIYRKDKVFSLQWEREGVRIMAVVMMEMDWHT